MEYKIEKKTGFFKRFYPSYIYEKVEDIPYELRFYAYFTKKYNTSHEMINTFWDRKLEV